MKGSPQNGISWHIRPIISKLSTELIADRYQLSKYHSKAQRLVTDEERLFELVPTLMINFKFAIISEEMKHMMYALQDPAVANDEEQCTSIMKRYSELREIKSIMAKRLGDRSCTRLNHLTPNENDSFLIQKQQFLLKETRVSFNGNNYFPSRNCSFLS